MIKKICLFIYLFVTSCIAFSNAPHMENRLPLSNDELTQLVSGNTMIGFTCHSQSVYLLYFYPDGRLFFKKNASNKESRVGQWWVKDNEIMSQWKTYKRSGVNKLRYYHIDGNTYKPFNINNACGPAGTFGHPFMVFQGRYDLIKSN